MLKPCYLRLIEEDCSLGNWSRFLFELAGQRTPITANKFRLLVISIALLKFLLAAVTPLGFDYVLYMLDVVTGAPAVSYSPWIILVRGIYSFWLWLPVQHGNLLAVMKAPAEFLVIAYPHQLVPSFYLLSALVKTPLVLSDLSCAVLIWRLTLFLTDSRVAARSAAVLWLSNPLVSFFVEMWGSIDVILITLSMVSIYLIVRERTKLSGVALACGIALRASPLISWLALLVWIVRKKDSRTNILLFVASAPLALLGYLFWISQGAAFLGTLNFLQAIGPAVYNPVEQSFLQYSVTRSTFDIGFAVIAIVAYCLLAAHVWPTKNQAIVGLCLSVTLLVYAFAYWVPPAFLWAMPLIAIRDSAKTRAARYSPVYYVILFVYVVTSYNLVVTTSGSSLFFIPTSLVPDGNALSLALAQFFDILWPLRVQVLSVVAGFSFVYAISVLITTLREVHG